MSASLRIALVGCPNAGKSALFNALTGYRQKVANYPGVTVEKRSGNLRGIDSQTEIELTDLPGAYSLQSRTPDEAITRDVLLGKIEGESKPDRVIFVADALHPERSLAFFQEVATLGIPMLIAWNLSDLAEVEGITYAYPALEKSAVVPVFPTVAIEKSGTEGILRAIEGDRFQKSAHPYPDSPLERYQKAEEWLLGAMQRKGREGQATRRTTQIDRILLHPVLGIFFLVAALLLIFQSVFTFSAPLQDGIELWVGKMGGWIGGQLPEGPVKSLWSDGIVAGVGSVVVFLPQILLLYLWILVLEDSGYMARAAFLMDRIMGKFGLHGRAFLPLLSSHACAIPGILSTRAIEDPKDRLATILIAPLTTCSARLPVYTLLIAAFIPATQVWGVGLQGLTLFLLYFAGIGSAVLMGLFLRRSVLKGPTSALLLELPIYRRPSIRNLLSGLWERSMVFLKNAGTIIFALSILLWFLSSYPKPKTEGPPILQSYAGKIGKRLEPLLRPIGFDWRISVSLIPGFAAREVMVGALATVHAVEAPDDESAQNYLKKVLPTEWGLATALSLLAWYIFAPQCLSTFAVIRRETQSWPWSFGFLFFYTALAYAASWVVYHTALFFGAMGPLS